MKEKIFRTTQRVLVMMECVGVANEDGNVEITEVRQVELPSPEEVMESMSAADFDQLDKDFAEAT